MIITCLGDLGVVGATVSCIFVHHLFTLGELIFGALVVFVYYLRVLLSRFQIGLLILYGVSIYIPWLCCYISCNPFRPLLS